MSDMDNRIEHRLNVQAHPDQTSPMTVGPEGFLEPKPATIARVIALMLERAGEHRPNADTLADIIEQILPVVSFPAPPTEAGPLSHPEPVAQEAVAIAHSEDDMPERIWAGDFDSEGFGHCVAGMQGDLYSEYVRADLAHPSPSPEQGEETAALACLEELANRPLGISLEEWCRLSGPILGALQSLSALRARVAELEARATELPAWQKPGHQSRPKSTLAAEQSGETGHAGNATPQAGASEAEPAWGPAVRAATRQSHASLYATPPERAERERCAKIAARLLKGYDNGDDGFGVEEAIRSGRAAK